MAVHALAAMALAFFGLATQSAPVGDLPPSSASKLDRAAIAEIEARGGLIFAYDRAAWIGTDLMMAALENPAEELKGYIVDGEISAPRVTFYGGDEAAPSAIYIIRFAKDEVASHGRPRTVDEQLLSSSQKRMIAARNASMQHALSSDDFGTCTPAAFNTVVIPPRPDGMVEVYLLSPQVETGVLPMGGHYRLTIDTRNQVVQSRAFARSCLMVNRPNESDPEFFFITHLLDPHPTELHFFSSYHMTHPLIIGVHAPRPHMWIINRGRLIDDRPIEAEDIAKPSASAKP